MEKIFNSLGSNYNFSYVMHSLFSNGSKKDLEKLEPFLSKKYDGEAALLYKGREAITAALKMLDLPEDSQIAINGFTCVAVFNAIRTAGYEPVCLDLEETGGINFTPKNLEKEVKKNKNIKVVIIQNTLGYPCDIKEIEKICKENKLVLIEDLAHCVGTQYADGREAGTVGDFVCLSFSQDKIIDAVSGGALIIRNSEFRVQNSELKKHKIKTSLQIKDRLYPAFTYKIRWLYQFGLGKYYHFVLKKLGLMSNVMNESFYEYYSLPYWNAKMAFSEFQKLSAQLSHRRKIANIYVELLPDTLFMFDKKKTLEAVELSANLRFPIFLEDRKKILQHFKKSGIFLYDIWYSDVAPECPNAVGDAKIILNLPTHINITEKDARFICERIKERLGVKMPNI